MKLNCENCIKSDVCEKKKRVKDAIEALSLNKNYQELEKQDIKIEISCKHFLHFDEILGRNKEAK